MKHMLIGSFISAACAIAFLPGCYGGSNSQTASNSPSANESRDIPRPMTPPTTAAPATTAPKPAPEPDVHPTNTPDTTPPPPVQPQKPAAETPSQGDPKVATFAGLTGPKPATWQWHPPQRQFSVAEYTVPGRDGSDQARIDVFKAGGTVEQNIQRWKMMFHDPNGGAVEPKVSNLEADGMPITLVEFAGEYRAMGSPNFTPNQLFLCAVVESPDGQIFIRFVGPAGTVEPNRADFMNMIRNLKKVEPEK